MEDAGAQAGAQLVVPLYRSRRPFIARRALIPLSDECSRRLALLPDNRDPPEALRDALDEEVHFHLEGDAHTGFARVVFATVAGLAGTFLPNTRGRRARQARSRCSVRRGWAWRCRSPGANTRPSGPHPAGHDRSRPVAAGRTRPTPSQTPWYSPRAPAEPRGLMSPLRRATRTPGRRSEEARAK